MKTWRIVALIGTLVFIFAAPLPLISVFGETLSMSLIDVYSLLGQPAPTQGGDSQWSSALTGIGVALMLTIILFPVTLILGLISVATSPKLAIVSGVLGVICWSGSVFAVLQLKALIASYPGGQLAASLIQIGFGVYVGILGALMLLASYFVAKHEEAKAVVAPTPSPPPQPPTAPQTPGSFFRNST